MFIAISLAICTAVPIDITISIDAIIIFIATSILIPIPIFLSAFASISIVAPAPSWQPIITYNPIPEHARDNPLGTNRTGSTTPCTRHTSTTSPSAYDTYKEHHPRSPFSPNLRLSLRSCVVCRSALIGMTPLEIVTTFARHIECEARLGLSTQVESTAKAMPSLVRRLRELKPSMAMVTEVFEYLAQDVSPFSKEQKQQIAEVAQSTMVDTTVVGPRAVHAVKTQQHLHLHNYLPARLWAVLESADSKENKFRQLAHFMCANLGLRNPDAKTKRLAVVIVHLASRDTPCPTIAYNDVNHFGDIMDRKRSSVCTKQTMASFPEDPSAFQVSYPEAFGADDLPIACRVDLSAITERCRKDVTPCRSTNNQVRAGSRTVVAAPAAPAVDSVNGLLFHMLDKYMFSKGHEPLSLASSFHRRSPSVESHASPRGSPGALPLEDEVQRPSSLGASSEEPLGGITPSCLNPRHDKLAALMGKLGVATDSAPIEDGATRVSDSEPADAAAPLPRLRKRPAEDDGEDATIAPVGEKEKKATPSMCKRPAAAPKAARTSAVAPKAARSSVSTSVHEGLLKKAAKVARPPPSVKPTAHAGGKIYFSETKGCFRVYLRVGDRIEKCVAANPANKADIEHKFQICCALIENDKR